VARALPFHGPGQTLIALAAWEQIVSHVSPKDTDRTSPQRVVLALPEAEWARDLVEGLKRAGFLPHCTPSAEVAAMVLSFRDPIAIFIDESLLETSGYRLLDTFRVSAPEAPVFLVVDAADTEKRVHALARGVEDCLCRPFSPQEAVIRLRRVLERHRAARRLGARLAEVESQAERRRESADALRSQLRADATILARTIDFQQRLEFKGDPRASRERFLRHLHAQLRVAPLAVLVAPREGATHLVPAATLDLAHHLGTPLRLPVRGAVASLLETSGAPLVLSRLAGVPGMREEAGILAAGGFTAVVPLLCEGRLDGIVLLGEAASGGTPDDATLRLAHFLVSAAAPGFRAERRWTAERELSLETLSLLVNRLEGRNAFLQGHAVRVASLCEDLGTRLGLGAEELTRLSVIALLHDVGRFEVDPLVWCKTDRLSEAEWRVVHRHPVDGARLLEDAAWPASVLGPVRHHHERWDGTGYPDGLRGTAIPYPARVLAVADSLEALTSPRPHRAALPRADALRVIREGAGAQFDPDVTAILVEEYSEEVVG
jgi:HD-GYP domain-containing protein (c-di-GMP phosphodiesterase class II)